MIKAEPLSYTLNNRNFIGHLAYNSTDTKKRPAVLVVPTWMGLNDFTRQKAESLAALGYVAYGVDLFGESKEAKTPDEARELTAPLVADRQIVHKRLQTALLTLRSHPLVDPQKVAAIGFCFGGRCVIEFAKGGVDLLGAVSFHASLGGPNNKPVQTASTIPSSILILHGYQDKLAPEDELLKLQKELSDKNADWQVIVYGKAMHAFMNPKVNLPTRSLQYDEQTAHRAWIAMQNFLNEIFLR